VRRSTKSKKKKAVKMVYNGFENQGKQRTFETAICNIAALEMKIS